MRRALFTLTVGIVVLGTAPAPAQEWINTVFPNRAHDAGTVARGSKIRHSFKIVNTTSQDIHIADWRTKCGCTEVRIGARDIPPGTQTVVEAVLDTTKFLGYKPSGLTLVLDQPQFIEVDLNLSCFIRGDITLNPGLVDFGLVPRGAPKTVNLTLTYAGGQNGWKVTEMVTDSKHVTAEITEISRGNGTVQYRLSATLKPSTPSGPFKDEIALKTTDPSSPTIPVSVVANVQSAVTVAPAVHNFGRVRAGQTVKVNVLVRSTRPFQLTEVKPERPDISVAKLPEGEKPFHTLTLSFQAPEAPGPYNATVDFATDVKDEPPARMTVFAVVVK